METKKALPHLPELDGLRGVAALSVFFQHFFQIWQHDPQVNLPLPFRVTNYIAGYGFLGVDIFFVLSGFLITSLLLVDREKERYFHNFYWKRALRILPVYAVHLLFAELLTDHHAGGYILLSLVFLANFASKFHVEDRGPSWTLSIEEQFYLIWPRCIRRFRLQTIYYLCLALISLSVGLRFIVPLWHGGANLRYTFYRADGLGLGAILACQWFSTDGRTPVIRRVLAALNSGVLLATVLLVGVVMLWFTDARFAQPITLTLVNYTLYRFIRFLVYRRINGGQVALLSSPVAVYLGNLSYALYMYHVYIFGIFESRLGHIPTQHPWAIFVRSLLVLAACIIACTLSRFALELPVQRLRRFVLLPRRSSA